MGKLTSLMGLVLVLAAGSVSGEDFELTLAAEWNLVSVPLHADDPRPDAVFGRQHLGPVWRWDTETGVYCKATEIKPGEGYWICHRTADRNGAGHTVTVSGEPLAKANLYLEAGWNLVGAIPGYERLGNPDVALTMWTWDAPGQGIRRVT